MDPERHKIFLKLLLEHQPKIYAYILSLVSNYTDADDVFQNVSEVIWRRFDQYQLGTNFLSWALRCAHLEVLNFRKKRSSSRQIIFDNETFEQMLPIANDEVNKVDYRRDALEECLEKLGNIGKEIIRMRYNLGLKPKQIASHLGYTVANTYKMISRIHGKLLSCIESARRSEGYTNE